MFCPPLVNHTHRHHKSLEAARTLVTTGGPSTTNNWIHIVTLILWCILVNQPSLDTRSTTVHYVGWVGDCSNIAYPAYSYTTFSMSGKNPFVTPEDAHTSGGRAYTEGDEPSSTPGGFGSYDAMDSGKKPEKKKFWTKAKLFSSKALKMDTSSDGVRDVPVATRIRSRCMQLQP